MLEPLLGSTACEKALLIIFTRDEAYPLGYASTRNKYPVNRHYMSLQDTPGPGIAKSRYGTVSEEV